MSSWRRRPPSAWPRPPGTPRQAPPSTWTRPRPKEWRTPLRAPFRPLPVVDGHTNSIRFDGAHGLRGGQPIVYDSGGGVAIGGLTSGETYYVHRVNASTLQLARSELEALEDPRTLFGAGDVDSAHGPGSIIDLGYAHGFRQDDAVVYRNGGGTDIGGLRDGTIYSVDLRDNRATAPRLRSADGTLLDLDALQGSGAAAQLAAVPGSFRRHGRASPSVRAR